MPLNKVGMRFRRRESPRSADAHQSQVSMNKVFLQSIGIVEPEGIKLTEAGKRYGLGLTNEKSASHSKDFKKS